MALFGKKEICIFCKEEKKAKLTTIDGSFVCKHCLDLNVPTQDIINGVGSSIGRNKNTITAEDLYKLKEMRENEIRAAKEINFKNEEIYNSFSMTNAVQGIFEIDENKRQWIVPKLQYGSFGDRIPSAVYSFDDVLEFELLEDGDTVTKGGLGSAVVGGALFGGTGAVVGSVTGKKTTKKLIKSLRIKITLSDLNNPVIYIDLINKETKVDSSAYKSAYNNAQTILSLLANMKNNQSSNNKENEVQEETNNNSLEQIKTLKELLDIGAITEDEFNTKKKELLRI